MQDTARSICRLTPKTAFRPRGNGFLQRKMSSVARKDIDDIIMPIVGSAVILRPIPASAGPELLKDVDAGISKEYS